MRIVNYRSNYNIAAALILKETRNYFYLTQIDVSGLSLIKVPVCDEKHFSPIEYKGKPYPVKRAVRLFKAAGRKYGMTKMTKRYLAEAA